MKAREVVKGQAAIDLALHALTLLLREAVPLVDGDHHGAAALHHHAREAHVLVVHALGGVHHHDHHVRGVDRLQRLHDTEFLDRVFHARASAHAGGVDQYVTLTVTLIGNVDTDTRRTNHDKHHHALLAEHAVHERGLADVGAAHHRDADAVLLARRHRTHVRQARAHERHQ